MLNNVFKDEDYLPFMQRPSTWGGLLVALILILIISGISTCHNHFFETNEVQGQVVDATYTHYVSVQKWGAVRKTGKSYVPDGAFDVEEDYERVCAARDSMGNCTRWEYEDVYDYSVMDWQDFRDLEFQGKGNIKPPSVPEFSDKRIFKVDVSTYYKICVEAENIKDCFGVDKDMYNRLYQLRQVTVVKRKHRDVLVEIKG